jgi:hypothetical protein
MASAEANIENKKATCRCGNEFFFKLDDICQANKPDSFFVQCQKCKEPVEISNVQSLNCKEYEALCCRFGLVPFA